MKPYGVMQNRRRFQKIQSFLVDKTEKHSTLHPKEQKHKKVCIRDLSYHTESQFIIDSLEEYTFTGIKAVMLTNRNLKTFYGKYPSAIQLQQNL